MKKLYDGVQRFCAAHPRFGIPNLMRVIVIGNVAVYVLMLLTQANDANALSFLTFNLNALLHGEVWRLVTFVFVPAYSSPFALLISLYFYYWIGSTLERQWGTAKFNLYYISGALLTVLGVVLAMGKINEPPEVLGHYIGAALVGTFFGILCCYGLFGPMGAKLENFVSEEHFYYHSIKEAVAAAIRGSTPLIAVEYGRRAIPYPFRPNFPEMEEKLKNG